MISISRPLVNDSRLDALPELADLSGAIEVTAAGYANGAALLAAHPPSPGTKYLFRAGDYTTWGNWAIANVDGTAQGRICFLFEDTETHPLKRTDSERALFQNIVVSYSSFLVFHGLAFKSSISNQAALTFGTNGCIWSECHHEGWDTYAMRVRIGSYGNKVQRCTFFDPLRNAGDNLGVQLQIFDWSGDDNLHNNLVLDSEFRNCADAIQITDAAGIPLASADGTIAAGNDIYTTAEYYSIDDDGVRAGTENAFDLKHGSLDSDNPVIIENNRIWGLRYTDPDLAGSGSNGAAFTNQRFSENVIFRNNIIDDCVVGVYEQPWVGGSGKSGARSTLLSGNVWANIKRHHPNDDAGGGVYLASNMPLTINGDRIVDCWRVAASANDETNGAHTISNLVVAPDTPTDNFTDDIVAGTNNYGEKVFLRYQRRRFSGPEWVEVGEKPIPSVRGSLRTF